MTCFRIVLPSAVQPEMGRHAQGYWLKRRTCTAVLLLLPLCLVACERSPAPVTSGGLTPVNERNMVAAAPIVIRR